MNKDEERSKLWEEADTKEARALYAEKYAAEIAAAYDDMAEEIGAQTYADREALAESGYDTLREMVGKSLRGKTQTEQARIMIEELYRRTGHTRWFLPKK